MERTLCLNFRLLTANILGVLKFRTFTVSCLFYGSVLVKLPTEEQLKEIKEAKEKDIKGTNS